MTIENWWNEAHARDETRWVSGVSGEDEWRNLRVSGLMKAGDTVLNIGVGLGYGTVALVAAGLRVSVLDISPIALDRVRGQVDRAWLASSIEQLPDQIFDFALSHLVAQHMSDDDLAHQVRHVVRSLKPSGIFALQFAMLWAQGSGTVHDALEYWKVGGVCRTLGRIVEMAEDAGAVVSYAGIVGSFPQYGSVWYTAHLCRRDAKSPPALTR